MNGNTAVETLESELTLATGLLKNTWGMEFPRPVIIPGDEHCDEFFDIRTTKEYIESLQVMMVYQDIGNRIFVPDRMLNTYGEHTPEKLAAERIFSFLHECTHAYHAHKNPCLHSARIRLMVGNRSRIIREKGYAHEVFSEGSATYTAVRAALNSGNPALAECGRGYHEDITSAWDRWSKNHLLLLAKIYGFETSDLRPVLYGYLWRELGPALLAHRYHLGYAFMSELEPDHDLFREMSMLPPSSVRHLVYPGSYLAELYIQ